MPAISSGKKPSQGMSKIATAAAVAGITTPTKGTSISSRTSASGSPTAELHARSVNSSSRRPPIQALTTPSRGRIRYRPNAIENAVRTSEIASRSAKSSSVPS